MNRIRLAITAALLLPLAGCATLPPDTAREEAAYQVLAAVDGAETLRTADNPTRYQEENPILGRHPAPDAVLGYFAVCGIAHYGITDLLVSEGAPHWLITAWEATGISLESAMVIHNTSVGIVPTISVRVRGNKRTARHGTRRAANRIQRLQLAL
jgi:hypothetical protein